MSTEKLLNHPIVKAEHNKLRLKIELLEDALKKSEARVHMHKNRGYQLEKKHEV